MTYRYEEALVKTCIAKARRPRHLIELCDRRRRGGALDRLNPMQDLDERYVTWLPSGAEKRSRPFIKQDAVR